MVDDVGSVIEGKAEFEGRLQERLLMMEAQMEGNDCVMKVLQQ
jgi:hypothetical protein